MAIDQSNPSARARLGAWGEQHAAELVSQLGWQVVARNWRCPTGELDLVALEPVPGAAPIAVAIEVKSRAQTTHGHPFEAITAAKADRLHRLIRRWVGQSGLPVSGLRVDVICIVKHRGYAPVVEHRRGVA